MATKNKVTLGAGRFFGLAFASVSLFVLFVCILNHQVVLKGLESQLKTDLRNERVILVNQLVASHFRSLEAIAGGIAAGITFDPINPNTSAISAKAMAAVPDVRRFLLFGKGQISRDDHPDYPVSFAALELLKKVEADEASDPVAFKGKGNKWFLLIARALKTDAGVTAGTLLLITEPSTLQHSLSTLPAGKYQIYQKTGANQTLVVEAGEGEGVASAGPLSGSNNWIVAYTLPASSPLEVSKILFVVFSLLVALVSGGISTAVLMYFSSRVERDISSLTVYSTNILSNGSSAPMKAEFRLTDEMMQALSKWKGARIPPENKQAVPAVTKTKQPVTSLPGDGSLDLDIDLSDDDLIREGESFENSEPSQRQVLSEESEPLFSENDILDIQDDPDDLLGLNKNSGDEPDEGLSGFSVVETPTIEVDPSLFRAYDIRGIPNKNLSPEVMTEIGKALGGEALARGQTTLCLGRDGRHSSLALAKALSDGLLHTGVNVIDIGLVPTPVLYFATHHLNTGSGAMITGSHNPPEYNGVKIMLGGQSLSDEGIQGLLARINRQNFPMGSGKFSHQSVTNEYIETIVADIAVAAPLKVVIDAGNGAAGEIAPVLLTELGCEVLALNCEIDGDFPAHHPDPGNPDNLKQLIDKVLESGADLGIAFDGDGDRLGVVTNTGKIIWPDRLLMLFAKDVVSRNPGADVIFDVKCSRHLNGLISSYGGRPVMWRAGHSVIKAKMLETGALLAGELSGHIFFKERWFGFDDGIYSAARLLEILGVEDGTVDQVFEEFPNDIATPELLVPVSDETKFQLMERLQRSANWSGGSPSSIDGVRVEFADGWGLCRASNTTPALTMRFEAESDEAVRRIQSIFKNQLLAVEPTLKLPF